MYTRWSPELTRLLDSACGTKSVHVGNLEYHVFAGNTQEALLSIADTIDDVIENGCTQKHSKKSTASLFSVGGQTFFGKHVRFHQKAFGLRFRYFLQPSRSFWTAVVANRLQEAGIGTPKVYAMGERRTIQLISDSYLITEALKDLYTRQTRLQIVRDNGDLDLEGEITGYDLTPLAVQEDALSAQTRLTITVRFRYTNRVKPEEDTEQTVSAYREFDSNVMLQDVQDDLCDEIIDELVDQIYNATVANW